MNSIGVRLDSSRRSCRFTRIRQPRSLSAAALLLRTARRTPVSLSFRERDSPGPVVDSSPEKAGVGGSISSLATIFSTTYKPSKTQFHSSSFQNFWPVEICLRRNEARSESVSWGRIVPCLQSSGR